MNISPNTLKIGAGVVIIVGTIVGLAFTGIGENRSYYLKIGEVLQPQAESIKGDKIHHSQLRVEGYVVPGSIQQNGTHVDFTMNEYESHSAKAATGKTIQVDYKGTEPPPDTFKDDSLALAIGTYGYDGKVHATALQAKCASKYAPAGPNQPGAKPSAPAPPKSNASAQIAGASKPAV